MNTIKGKWGLILLMIFSVSVVCAQTTISGNVSDENGEPLVGVNVLLENTTKGAVSDLDGDFIINDVENGS